MFNNGGKCRRKLLRRRQRVEREKHERGKLCEALAREDLWWLKERGLDVVYFHHNDGNFHDQMGTDFFVRLKHDDRTRTCLVDVKASRRYYKPRRRILGWCLNDLLTAPRDVRALALLKAMHGHIEVLDESGELERLRRRRRQRRWEETGEKARSCG